MIKLFRKYFIPHSANDHRPHFLREESTLFLAAIIVAVFLLALLQVVIITQTDLIAAIFPSVLVDLANQDRAASGVGPLKISPTLEEAARLKALDMAAKGYFAHTSPEGVTPWFWFSRVGYDFMVAGENLAVDFSDSVDVEQAWMNSPSHRANILQPQFTEIGIALSDGFWQGRPTTFIVQLFGRPAPTFDEEPAPAPQEVFASVIPTPTVEPISQTPVVEQAPDSVETPAEEVNIETLFENETFIAVRNPGAEETATPASESLGETNYASYFEELLLSPKRTLAAIYLGLATLITLAIIFMVGVEVGRHHPKHVAYGLLLLVLIAVLFYLYRHIIISEVLIA